jgi:hypothetical protein
MAVGETSRMIVISRDGKTVVITGWRAWLAGAAAVLVAWLLLALVAFVWIGLAVTVGLVVLLAIPALLIVALVQVLLRRGAG